MKSQDIHYLAMRLGMTPSEVSARHHRGSLNQDALAKLGISAASLLRNRNANRNALNEKLGLDRFER